ncbi:hypothetical protein [Glaciecola sp. SC05]|uniref:hypothetical protein n=1 Tax=Glaciecola sp. SC05 TaxID=1987355 RepID=UPI003527CDB4
MEKIFEIAANVSTPLALSGLFAAILFFVLRKILEKDIFPSLTKSGSADIVKLIINRLFVLALFAMILGFSGYIISLSNTSNGEANLGKTSEAQKEDKYVFVSSQGVKADFGGLATADLICKNLASKAGLTGEYKAWLSDSNVGPADRFNINHLAYVLPSKKIVIDDFANIFNCKNPNNCLRTPINENENGIPVPRPQVNSPQNRVWTATQADGLPLGNSCKNWTSELGSPNSGPNNTVVTLGDPSSKGVSWTSSYSANCDELILSFYCFEQ